VIPVLVESFTKTDEIFDLAGSWAHKHGFVQPGHRLVVTAGVPVGQPGTTNLLKIIEIENG
jgi:pyruvate kinase